MNELERAAWNKRTASTQHPPIMALKAAIDDIEKGELKPIQAVVVLVQRHDDGEISVSSYQSGEQDTLAIVGSLMRCARILDMASE